jgi:hypothetical protein
VKAKKLLMVPFDFEPPLQEVLFSPCCMLGDSAHQTAFTSEKACYRSDHFPPDIEALRKPLERHLSRNWVGRSHPAPHDWSVTSLAVERCPKLFQHRSAFAEAAIGCHRRYRFPEISGQRAAGDFFEKATNISAESSAG